jgi:prepilin-type N-terminal cleavage/methylation domain-containing protein
MRRAITQRGYTAVEVLISIAIFGIGAAGVIAMQRASIQGNYDARSLDMASSISREWQERLHRDATLWTAPSNPPSPGTTWLHAAVATPNTWITPNIPSVSPDGVSPAFNMLGQDLTLAQATNPTQGSTFCVQVNLQSLSTTVARVSTRVMWLRDGGTFICPVGLFDPTADPRFRTLTTTTVMRGPNF